ncbi:hypothetical protein [Paracoccus sp. PAMC 22219]|nr:hypothetical protein [Paracoccus sp. PAMC 22219]
MEGHAASLAFIAFLLLQRGAELLIAGRNTRRLMAQARSNTAPRIIR